MGTNGEPILVKLFNSLLEQISRPIDHLTIGEETDEMKLLLKMCRRHGNIQKETSKNDLTVRETMHETTSDLACFLLLDNYERS